MSRRKARAARRNRRILLCAILLLAVVGILAVLIRTPEQNNPSSGGDSTLEQTESTSSDLAATTDIHTTDSEKNTSPGTSEESNTSTSKNTVTSAKSDTKTNTDAENTSDINDGPTDSFDKDEWYMLLANGDNPVPQGFSFPTAKVYSAGQNWTLDARCADDMKEMIAAAKKDGVSLIICSAYRSVERQTTNFNNKVKEYVNKGYSEKEAKEITATIIAVPGTSEHHTGLAADIVTPSYQRLNEGFADTEAFRWLYEHCAEYGFILRYAKEKQDITKIIYEPWHYRYVGKEAAQIIMNEGICLEEFLEKYGT